MNRRGFFGLLSGAAALGAAKADTVTPSRRIEPFPGGHHLRAEWIQTGEMESGPQNECLRVDADLSQVSVGHALEQLKWTPNIGPIALLCVSPVYFAEAKQIEAYYCGELAVYASRFCDDTDTWFIAWNGRRMGSSGA